MELAVFGGRGGSWASGMEPLRLEEERASDAATEVGRELVRPASGFLLSEDS